MRLIHNDPRFLIGRICIQEARVLRSYAVTSVDSVRDCRKLDCSKENVVFLSKWKSIDIFHFSKQTKLAAHESLNTEESSA